MLEPNTVMPECINRFANEEVFYDLRNQVIYSAMLEMYDRREAIDVITLSHALKARRLLEPAGGVAYIAALPDAVPSAANFAYYADIIAEKAQLRSGVQLMTRSVERIYDTAENPLTVLEETERNLQNIITQKPSGQISIKEAVKSATELMEQYFTKADVGDIPTGLVDLDRATSGGLHKAEFTLLAARPSVGKTSLAMNIAERAAVDCKLPVGVFSMEMTTEQLTLRTLCSRARVDGKAVRDGSLTVSDFQNISRAAVAIANSPLFIDETSGLSITQFCAKARRLHKLHGIRLFIIDYLQLMSAGRGRFENRQQEITKISCGIKSLAKELKVPVIALSQLNRDVERDGKNRMPRSSDLRESGALEQDADNIWMLWCPDKSQPERIQLEISKQRNGQRDVTVPLQFIKGSTRFESAVIEHD